MHYADNCNHPSDDEEEHGVNNFQFSINTHQLLKNKKFSIDDLLKVVIIDSASTVHLFQNKDFVKNFREVKKHTNLDTNRGMVKLGEVVDAEFDEVWFSCGAIANAHSHM